MSLRCAVGRSMPGAVIELHCVNAYLIAVLVDEVVDASYHQNTS